MGGAYAFSATGLYDTIDITANTNRRDVSELLDIWYHEETPMLNYVGWGPESGGLQIEWIYEALGKGWIKAVEEITASAQVMTLASTDLESTAEALKAISSGTMLMGWSSLNATHCIMIVYDTSVTGEFSVDTIEPAADQTIDALEKLYILGNFANEASKPRSDSSRARTIVTNNFAILRKDVRISGSMAATDMYAVDNELRHQIRNRLREMQFERERAMLLSLGGKSAAVTRTASTDGYFRGVYSFLLNDGGAGSAVDTTTTSLTESTFNSVLAECWENGCKPNIVVGSSTQIRKFTDWDRARVRTQVDERMGGKHVTQYLTDMGIVVDLVPLRAFPGRILMVLDTNKIKLRAKKGRKLIVEKLGKIGDLDEWQMISEFSVECRGTDIGRLGGLFNKLT